MPIRGRLTGIVFAVAAFVLLCAHRGGAEEALLGSFLGDSLLMPTESFVLTREDLVERNIHSLDDILRLLPGVVLWREGPVAADGGFSIDGRGGRGVNLLVNGSPVVGRYTLESLSRFIPLSRLLRVEVLYSGSPYLTGDLSSGGAVNIVLEEGGREGPTSEINFTYGGSKRRARRAWFATPRGHIGGVLAYDEYLQDAAESYPAIPQRLLGDYDMRSVLGELMIHTAAGDDVLCRFQRYEDSFVGTALRSNEDVRWSGFASEITYRRAGFSSTLRQRALLLSRRAGKLREHTLDGAARWAGSFGGLAIRAFTAAERSEFENQLWGTYFSPSYTKVEGGAALGGRLPSNMICRLGFFGGDHSVVGRYGSVEAAIGKIWSERFSQDVMLARRQRVPSAQELFQPEADALTNGDSFAAAGNSGLASEVSDELSIGARLFDFSFSLFGRDEKSRISISDTDPPVYHAEGGGRVTGARGRFAGMKSILGFGCSLSLGIEGFPQRSGLAPGIPRYRALGEVGVRHGIFKGSELVSIKLNAEAAGERSWDGTDLGPYRVFDLSASLSIMSARVSFDFKNMFDTKYETVPGFEMPRRHYLIGVFWELFD